MLSLTKKSDVPVAAPLWHTNFRNFERLPDTKVVRTTFFVNTAAGALALGLLLWVGYNEYKINNLTGQVAEAQAQIDANAKQNAEALRLTNVFLEENKKISETEAFLKMPILPSEFIELLAQSLPKEISIDFTDIRNTIDGKNQTYILRGQVAGSRAEAAGSASRYVDVLRAYPRLGSVFDPITLDRLTPDGTGRFMSIEVSLKVKEGKK